MPFNQLLLPLIGGYLFVNFTFITSYWASRQGKEQLLMASALVGIVALAAARVLAVLLMATAWGREAWQLLHLVAPYPGIGTALLAFLLCLALRVWINWFWPRDEAALWLYGTGTYNSLERLFFLSVLRVEQVRTRGFVAELALRMLWHPPLRLGRWLSRLLAPRAASDQAGTDAHPADRLDALETSDGLLAPVPVLLSLKDRKVYAGWLEWIPPLRADASPYLRLIPVWSGYRDAQTLRVVVTENYSEDIFSGSELPAAKVISTGDIANASLFDPDVFDRFGNEPAEAEQGESDPDATPRAPRPRAADAE